MDIVGLFTANHRIQGWREVGAGWVTWLVVVPVIWVLLAMLLKLVLEKRALSSGSGSQLYRGPARTRLALLVAFLGVTCTLPLIWLASRDFKNVVEFAGLGKGILAAWVLFLLGGLLLFALRFRDHMPWKRVH